MPSKTHNRAILYLIVANTIWGAASPIFKLALENIPPFTLAFLRFGGASVLLLPFVYKILSVDRKDWFRVFLLSFFGISLNISFFFFGLQLSPSINAPIIASAGPVFLYLLSIIILHEKAHPKVLIGMVFSLIGVLVIVGQPILDKGTIDGNIAGNIFFVIATLGSVVHAIISKEVLPHYHALTITFWSFVIGSMTFLPFFLLEIPAYHPFASLDYRGVLGIIFGVVLSSALAYALYDWGIKRIDAQEIGLFSYLDPVIAAILAIPLLGESLTQIYLFGSLLIFSGILIAEGRLHYHPIHRLKIREK